MSSSALSSSSDSKLDAWFAQSYRLHISVHFSPFDKHTHFGSVHSLSNCRPTHPGLPAVLAVHPSNAPPTVQLLLPSKSSILNQQDLVLSGPGQGRVSILRPGSWLFVQVSLSSPGMVEADDSLSHLS